jgi:hypothetical protein
LDRGTALVSPQFHVAFDAAFETVKDITVKSKWQNRAGFVAQRETLSGRTKVSERETTTDRMWNSEGANTTGNKKRKRQEKASTNQAVTPESQQQCEPAAANENNPASRTSKVGGGSHSEVMDRSTVTVTRSGRKTKPIRRLTIEAMMAEISPLTADDIEGELFCYAAMFPDDDDRDHDDPLLAYKAVSDPDTLYFHEAMKEKDRAKFL